MTLSELEMEALKREWIDQYVEVNPERPELSRFAGRVGRVATVNWNRKAVIDFQDVPGMTSRPIQNTCTSSTRPRPRPATTPSSIALSPFRKNKAEAGAPHHDPSHR